jgi:hypothetical protein
MDNTLYSTLSKIITEQLNQEATNLDQDVPKVQDLLDLGLYSIHLSIKPNRNNPKTLVLDKIIPVHDLNTEELTFLYRQNTYKVHKKYILLSNIHSKTAIQNFIVLDADKLKKDSPNYLPISMWEELDKREHRDYAI